MICYQIRDVAMDMVVYEYWADAPFVWTDTHYPWANTEQFVTIEAPVQPAVQPSLDTVTGKSWSAFDFTRRLTIQEHAAIIASTDPLVKAFHDRLSIAAAEGRRIYANDPDTVAGFQYMASIGILTADRAAEILA